MTTIGCINCPWVYRNKAGRSKAFVDQVLVEHYQMCHAERPDDAPHTWDPFVEVEDLAALGFEAR